LGAPVLVAAVAVLAVLKLNGEGAAQRPQRAKAPAMRTFHVGHRPNGVALAGGVAFVTSNDRPDVERFDATTGRRVGATRVGVGARSIVADGDGVWVAVTTAHEFYRIDATGKVTQRVRPGAAPTRVAVGLNSLWVAVNWTGGTDLLLRYGRDGRERRRTPFPRRIVGLATAEGHVWIAESESHDVIRVDPSGKRVEPWVTLADTITDLSAGNGYLWATLAPADSVARVSPTEQGRRTTTAVGHRPLRAVAAGGREFVTVNLDHTVKVIDPATGRTTGRAIGVPPNPYAIAADGRALWVTGLGEDTLTRIPYD
jgi:DNA-binding beta-propeller fold protein YncE